MVGGQQPVRVEYEKGGTGAAGLLQRDGKLAAGMLSVAGLVMAGRKEVNEVDPVFLTPGQRRAHVGKPALFAGQPDAHGDHNAECPRRGQEKGFALCNGIEIR